MRAKSRLRSGRRERITPIRLAELHYRRGCIVVSGTRWHARNMSWEPVTTGRSGAMVARGHGVFQKQVADPSVDLRIEAERLCWLRAQGIPAPEVLDNQRTLLVTRAVPGLTAADPWPAHLRPRVVAALARLTADLHSLSVEDCPFDRRLATAVPQALEADVDLTDLDPERHGWSREQLQEALLSQRPKDEDLVVCHGDLCLPNVVLDPESVEVTGVLDTSRLGVADRWTDLALATRSLASPQNPQFGQWAAEQYLAEYGIELDHQKCNYYRLLDEFF